MNIFVLDESIALCAKYHCDRHLVKMISEHNQILGSIAYIRRGVYRKKDITPLFIQKNFCGFPRKHPDGSPHPYGFGYANHPCTTWAGASAGNYEWLCQLTLAMCKEYTSRYGRKHAGEAICKWYSRNRPYITNIPMTPHVQAMPDECKNSDAVVAYRQYYRKYKAYFAKWAHSQTPKWFKQCTAEKQLQASQKDGLVQTLGFALVN